LAQDRNVVDLLTRACERGDWLSCGFPIAFDEAEARAACNGGRHDACMTVAGMSAMSQSGTMQEERWRLITEACGAGLIDACYAMAATGLDDDDDGDRVARAQLDAACKAGEADACAAVDRPLPDRALCDAGDYQACARLGAGGDASALALACEFRVPDACERIALDAVDSDPPDPRAAEHVARACKLGSETACAYDNRPAEIATGCVAYLPKVIDVARRRKIPILSGTDSGGRRWTAPSGPLLLLAKSGDIPWATYDDVARRLDIPVVVSIQGDSTVAPPVLDRAAAIILAPAFSSEPVMTPGPNALFAKIATSDMLIDEHMVVRAVLPRGPRVPATYARCIRALMTRP
jgi:hypothetical protein